MEERLGRCDLLFDFSLAGASVGDPLEGPTHQHSPHLAWPGTVTQIHTHFYIEDLSWHYTCGGTVHFCQVRISEIPGHSDHNSQTHQPDRLGRAEGSVSCLSTVRQSTHRTAHTFHTDLYWRQRSLLNTEIFTEDLYRLERSWGDLP